MTGSEEHPQDKLVIGLVGSFGSGCTVISQYLEREKGFFRYKLSTEIEKNRRAELAAQGRSEDDYRRDVSRLQDIGNELRENGHEHRLAQFAYEAFEQSGKDAAVFDGIRNVGEVLYLERTYPNFYLIAVNAGADVRYTRVHRQHGIDEADFARADDRDKGEDLGHGQQVRLCADRADYILLNDEQLDLEVPGQAEALHKKIDHFIEVIHDPASDPSHHELMMSVASNAALCSGCLQRQVGAVLVDFDHQMLASGFNEVPPRERDCSDEFGLCYRKWAQKKRKYKCAACGAEHESLRCPVPSCNQPFDPKDLAGKELDLCRAVHAEESAILQLAKRGGPSPYGSTLYTTTFPCALCAKMIASLGIAEVRFADPYPMKEGYTILEKAGVTVTAFEGVRAKAFHRVFGKTPAIVKDIASAHSGSVSYESETAGTLDGGSADS